MGPWLLEWKGGAFFILLMDNRELLKVLGIGSEVTKLSCKIFLETLGRTGCSGVHRKVSSQEMDKTHQHSCFLTTCLSMKRKRFLIYQLFVSSFDSIAIDGSAHFHLSLWDEEHFSEPFACFKQPTQRLMWLAIWNRLSRSALESRLREEALSKKENSLSPPFPPLWKLEINVFILHCLL